MWLVLARQPCIVLLTKTGPRCISFRCKITVSLAQGAVYDAEADVADPVFVRSTIGIAPSQNPHRGWHRESQSDGGSASAMRSK